MPESWLPPDPAVSTVSRGMNWANRTVFTGDNLDVLRGMDSGTGAGGASSSRVSASLNPLPRFLTPCVAGEGYHPTCDGGERYRCHSANAYCRSSERNPYATTSGSDSRCRSGRQGA